MKVIVDAPIQPHLCFGVRYGGVHGLKSLGEYLMEVSDLLSTMSNPFSWPSGHP